MTRACEQAMAGTLERLAGLLEGRVVVVGIGNSLRGDDGLGPLLAGRLARRLPVPCINAGISAERYLGKIVTARPDTLLVIDAMVLGLEPGEFALVEPQEISEQSLGAHGASVRTLCRMLSGRIQARILVLGVEPLSLRLGAGISARIRRSLRLLEEELVHAIESERR